MKIQVNTIKNINDIKNKNVLNIYFGIVVDINDPDGLGRIKVRLDDIDNKVSNENLPWCSPLVPKFFHVFPKKDEAVRVLISDISKPYNLRTWIGSIISQPQLIDYDPYYYSALTGTEKQIIKPLKNLKNTIDGKEIYPDVEDIGIIGRKNNDILLKNNEVIIRNIIKDPDNQEKLNRKNQGYIKLNFNNNITSNMIVADRIGLMSHKGVKKFKSILDNEEIENFFKFASPLAKGDLLINALTIIRNAILNHVHGGTNVPANNSNIINELKNLNFNNILSENIKIN